MSIGEKEKLLEKEEVLARLRERLAELEEEVRLIKSILAALESAPLGPPSIAEKVEEVRLGKKRIARIYYAENYVRMRPDFPMVLPGEVWSYLETTVGEIRERQEKEGIDAEEQVRLRKIEAPDGTVAEVRIENLYSTVDHIKAKAALKYVAELAYELYRARGAQ